MVEDDRLRDEEFQVEFGNDSQENVDQELEKPIAEVAPKRIVGYRSETIEGIKWKI